MDVLYNYCGCNCIDLIEPTDPLADVCIMHAIKFIEYGEGNRHEGVSPGYLHCQHVQRSPWLSEICLA